MIHPVSGLYSAPTSGVERIAGRSTPNITPQAEGEGPGKPRDLLARDPVKVASVSDLASRSMSFRLAARTLDDIDTYLNELL